MCSRQPTVGLVVLEIKQNIFLCPHGQFFSGLTTAQELDTLHLHRDFPGLYLMS
jgi:hypothetical protein